MTEQNTKMLKILELIDTWIHQNNIYNIIYDIPCKTDKALILMSLNESKGYLNSELKEFLLKNNEYLHNTKEINGEFISSILLYLFINNIMYLIEFIEIYITNDSSNAKHSDSCKKIVCQNIKTISEMKNLTANIDEKILTLFTVSYDFLIMNQDFIDFIERRTNEIKCKEFYIEDFLISVIISIFKYYHPSFEFNNRDRKTLLQKAKAIMIFNNRNKTFHNHQHNFIIEDNEIRKYLKNLFEILKECLPKHCFLIPTTNMNQVGDHTKFSENSKVLLTEKTDLNNQKTSIRIKNFDKFYASPIEAMGTVTKTEHEKIFVKNSSSIAETKENKYIEEKLILNDHSCSESESELEHDRFVSSHSTIIFKDCEKADNISDCDSVNLESFNKSQICARASKKWVVFSILLALVIVVVSTIMFVKLR